METEITSKSNMKFNCIKCDFKCDKKGDWNRHLLTSKHIMMYNVTQCGTIKEQKTSDHICPNCNKVYTSRNGLWVHKKKCNVIDLETEFKVLSNLVLDVIKKISLSKEVEIVKL